MAMARCRGERRMLAKAWLVGRLPTHVAASIRRSLQSARRHVVTPQRPGEERGRPPARRGRAGGFHWCPGHRGCRVTALATALATEFLLELPMSINGWWKWGNDRCQLRASRRLCPGPSKGVAKPPPRKSLPRCSVRCRSWPSPFPPVRAKWSKRCANDPEWLNNAATARFAGFWAYAVACCLRYTGATPGAEKWPSRRAAVRFQSSCNVDDTTHSHQ